MGGIGSGTLKRRFDPDIISELVEQRMLHRVTWKELPDYYMTLLPEDHSETKPDWRTLRNATMDDAEAWLMPTRVHRKMRVKLEQQMDKADLGVMLMSVLASRYGEWNILHSKMLSNAAATGLRDDDEEKLKAPKFTGADRERMDMLANEVTASLFKLSDIMRSMHMDDNALFGLMDTVGGESPGAHETQPEISNETISVLEKLQISVREESAKMRQEIEASHKRDGIGHFRVISPSDEDLIEDS